MASSTYAVTTLTDLNSAISTSAGFGTVTISLGTNISASITSTGSLALDAINLSARVSLVINSYQSATTNYSINDCRSAGGKRSYMAGSFVSQGGVTIENTLINYTTAKGGNTQGGGGGAGLGGGVFVAGTTAALRWPPKTGQAAKRESSLGTAGWPKVRHGEYAEEAQS